jgi:hypothetical protein
VFDQNTREDMDLPERQDDRGRPIIRETNGSQENAFRHAFGQALITQEYGVEAAIDIGYAHEDLPNIDTNRRRFTDESNPDNALFQADTVADLLNNSIGRRIALANPDADRRELARLVAETYWRDGLFQALPDGRGSFIVVRTHLPTERLGDVLSHINTSNDQLTGRRMQLD